MAKEFVRNIRNTKCIGKEKEPLETNEQNDLLNQRPDVFVRNEDYYHCLTNAVQRIDSLSKYIDVLKKENSNPVKDKVTVELSTGELEKELNQIQRDLSNLYNVEIKSLKEAIKELNSTIQNLPLQDLEEFKKKISELEDKITNGLSNLEKNINNIDSRLDDFSLDINKELDNKAGKEDLKVHLAKDVTEDTPVREFKNGVTICTIPDVRDFPSISQFGVSITYINKLHGGYGQKVITSNGDTWSRRTNSLSSWGPWYSSKSEIDNKAGKSYVDENISRTSTIVIANYDSKDSSKKGADIVINKGENASEKINEAIQSLQGIGGEVKLMEGNYNLEYGIAVNVDGVHLTGIPGATVLIQNEDWKGNPYADDRNSIIDTWRDSNRGNVDVEISNLFVKGGVKVSGSHGFYCYGSSTITNCISENSGRSGFYCKDSTTVNNCISKGSGGTGFSCHGSSTITNCISESSSNYGFYCTSTFKGVCVFNVLISDKLSDNSSSPAVVEYNIIKEG